MANRTGRMPWWGVIAMVGLATGCRTINRGVTESVLERGSPDEWQVRYGSRVTYSLTNESLTDMEFEGTTLAGDAVARYQRGLGPQAQCLADRTDRLLKEVSRRTGIPISTRTTIYLLRFDQRPQSFDITLTVEPNEFPLPLFVRAGEESCDAIIAQNHGYPYVAVHELVETSLVSRGDGQVLPDLSGRAMGMTAHLNNYTRWFRDGLANYAGYIAYEIVSRQIPSEQRLHYRQTLLHSNPFTSLAEIGDRLFTWRQSPPTKQERTYYNAALGLFLLIVDTYGEQTIPYIMNEIAAHESVDGTDLVEIVNRVLGTDVRRLAEDFEFPEVGVDLERMTSALALNRGIDLHEGLIVMAVTDGSAAAKAGLKEKDVITAVGTTPVTNLLDFELGLLRARRRSFAPVTLHRQGVGTQTFELPLEIPRSTTDTAPGDHRTPLITEQVGVSCVESRLTR